MWQCWFCLWLWGGGGVEEERSSGRLSSNNKINTHLSNGMLSHPKKHEVPLYTHACTFIYVCVNLIYLHLYLQNTPPSTPQKSVSLSHAYLAHQEYLMNSWRSHHNYDWIKWNEYFYDDLYVYKLNGWHPITWCMCLNQVKGISNGWWHYHLFYRWT